MNVRLFLCGFVVMLLGLVLEGCGAAAVTPEPTQPPPTPEATESLLAAVVLGTAQRYNEGDIEGALSYWNNDATFYMFGMPPTGSEMAQGKDQIRATFEENIANNSRWEVEVDKIKGDIVEARSKNWHDSTREIGVAPLEAHSYYLIEDGKIDTYAWVLTEESALKLKTVLAEVMPEEPAAEKPVESPVSELTVTIAGQTCSYEGPLALQAGDVQLTIDVQDRDKEKYAVAFFTLDEDKDFIDLMASTYRPSPPPWSRMFWIKEIDPGTKESYSMELTKGPVYVVCFVDPPEVAMGNIGPFAVSE